MAMVCVGEEDSLPTADGYRGIWYSNQPSNDRYRYKYSGGLGTYPSNILPMAYYASEADKTFFVYGGATGTGKRASLLEMVSYYDHATGSAPRPTIIVDKATTDAHHNPAISVDEAGYIWVFVSAHGGDDAFVYRSRSPYSIESFVLVERQEFTYPQPWYLRGFGFLFLFTRYTAGRELYWRTSVDGVTWNADRKCAGFGGHYQVSWAHDNRCGTAFNWHPPVGGLNARTNLYYVETADCGETWHTADASRVQLPLEQVHNDALVRDYQSESLLVYLMDLSFDQDGRPVILYLVSRGYESGPKNGPRIWTTARWTGEHWEVRPVTTSDHNYDVGCLHIEADGTWRIIGPTEPGPQQHCAGGEVVAWTSTDHGKTWAKTHQLTQDSPRNHIYVRRPVNAHPDFYAFWADGNPLQPSESRLYFATRAGEVFALPAAMSGRLERPRAVAGQA